MDLLDCIAGFPLIWEDISTFTETQFQVFSIFSQEIEWISCIPIIPPFNESFVNWFDDVDGNADNDVDAGGGDGAVKERILQIWQRGQQSSNQADL